MRLVVVSLLVLACVAFVSAHGGLPEIRKISILDILNQNPELKAELAKGIEEENRLEKSNPAPKPRRPAPTTTSSPVAQADTPVDPPASTDPTPQTNAPGRRRRPNSTHRFAGGRGKPRTRANAATEAPQEEKQQNGRQRPQNARQRPTAVEQPTTPQSPAAEEEQPARRRPIRPLRPRQQNGRTRPAAAAAAPQEETAAPVETPAAEVEEQGVQQQNARRRRPGARRRRPTSTTENAESVPAEEQPVERPTRRRTNGRTFPGRRQS